MYGTYSNQSEQLMDCSERISSETTRHNQHDERSERNAWLKEMRGWLMVLATVAASVTYQAGLNPPGGFWQEDDRVAGHRAGDPVLRDSVAARYNRVLNLLL